MEEGYAGTVPTNSVFLVANFYFIGLPHAQKTIMDVRVKTGNISIEFNFFFSEERNSIHYAITSENFGL